MISRRKKLNKINKKKDGTGYWIRISLGTNPLTGKREQKYLSAPKKKELDEKITKLKIKYRDRIDFQDSNKLTFEMIVDLYIEDREEEVLNENLAITTFNEERRRLKRDINPYFKNVDISKINLQMIKDFQSFLKTQPKKNVSCKDGVKKDGKIVLISNSTVNKKVKTLKGLLKFMLIKNFIAPLPLEAIKSLPEKKKKINFWTPEDFSVFIKYVQEVEEDPKIIAMFTLAYCTGARISELLAFNKNDFNSFTQYWHIHSAVVYDKKQKKSIIKLTTKTTKSDRQIKVDNLTLYLLKPLIDNSVSDYIFKYSEDLPRAEHYASRFKKYCRLAGVKTIRFHDLRHSHASLLIASGEDRFTVSKRLGHSSTTFTETIYGHLFPDKQNSITSLLEETFEKDFKKSVQFCAISPEENRKTGQKKRHQER